MRKWFQITPEGANAARSGSQQANQWNRAVYSKLAPQFQDRGLVFSPRGRETRASGFSLIELVVVVAMLMVVVSLAFPNLLQAIHAARLRSAATDLSGLLQVARIRA